MRAPLSANQPPHPHSCGSSWVVGAGYTGLSTALALRRGGVDVVVLERPNPAVEQLAPFAVPLPPEPLRWLLVRSMLGMVNAIDRRLDAQVRRGIASDGAVQLAGARALEYCGAVLGGGAGGAGELDAGRGRPTQ